MSEFYEIEVTTTKKYLVPINLNGWDIETTIKDWFVTHPPGNYHATRDGCGIGNSGKFVDYKVLNILNSPDDF